MKKMTISDSLRALANYTAFRDKAGEILKNVANRIDSEMIELPRDAYGFPIHVGDELWTADGECVIVKNIVVFENEMKVMVSTKAQGPGVYICTSTLTHERPDSFARIAQELEDFAEEYRESREENDTFIRVLDFAARIRNLAEKGTGDSVGESGGAKVG